MLAALKGIFLGMLDVFGLYSRPLDPEVSPAEASRRIWIKTLKANVPDDPHERRFYHAAIEAAERGEYVSQAAIDAYLHSTRWHYHA